MATKIHNPQLEYAVLLIQKYVPDAVRDNWRVLGTTAIMVGLALCPLVAWARESYQSYLDVGPGGMPYNVFGWMLQGEDDKMLAVPMLVLIALDNTEAREADLAANLYT